MSKPKVSIIMGAYNEEHTISKCIDSILAQTFRNWELIICNDCSTDKTKDIVLGYSDDRIKLINNECNLKLAASLNRCIDLAKGDYIARIDADDVSLPNRIELQVDFLDKHPEYDVVGSWASISNGEKIVGIRKTKEIPDVDLLLTSPPFIHPTIMMRSEVYQELDGYTVLNRTNRGQDWDLWFRFYALGHVGYNIQEPLLIYHASKQDLKKQSFKVALGYSQTALNGYKLLGVPKYKYVLAMKPIISFYIPEVIKRINRKEII